MTVQFTWLPLVDGVGLRLPRRGAASSAQLQISSGKIAEVERGCRPARLQQLDPAVLEDR